MSENPISFIFPAFANLTSEHPGASIPRFENHFFSFLSKSTKVIGPTVLDHIFQNLETREFEILSQYKSYIYSCAISAALRKNGVIPEITAGYSMGIYAAMCDAGSMRFEDGLILIKSAFESMTRTLKNESFGMISAIGLARNEINTVIDQHKLRVSIANQNSGHSYIISGVKKDLEHLQLFLLDEGALNIKFLEVTLPYHTAVAGEAADELSEVIKKITISDPQTRICSLIDQQELTTPEMVRREIVRNLYNPLNWHQTLLHLKNKLRIARFIECGLSTGLVRNARFVDETVRFQDPDSFWQTYVQSI